MNRNLLIRILEEERDAQGSYLALMNDIMKVTSTRLDRRTIQAIVEGEDKALTLLQLEALDRYLASRRRAGLAAVFDRPSVIRSLVEKERVVFLLGSQPRQEDRRIDLSRWDARAMHEVFVRINKVTGNVRVNLQDVLFRRAEGAGRGQDLYLGLCGEPWHRELDEHGPSVVCIGSQRACLATEVVLSLMFGVTPFTASTGSTPPPPFHFIWSPDERTRIASAFSRGHDEISHLDRGLSAEVRAGKSWAFQVGERLYPLKLRMPKARTYGVVAAQRRRDGRVFLVIAGLSGPGTYAASQMIDSLSLELPPGKVGEHSPVLWMAVEASVEEGEIPGDDREVTGTQALVGPSIWPAPAGLGNVESRPR